MRWFSCTESVFFVEQPPFMEHLFFQFGYKGAEERKFLVLAMIWNQQSKCLWKISHILKLGVVMKPKIIGLVFRILFLIGHPTITSLSSVSGANEVD